MEITVAQIREIVEYALDRELPAFSMDADFYEEYMMDSLGAVALVVEVQKQFDVRIPDERVPEIRSGEQLVAIIHELANLEDARKVEA